MKTRILSLAVVVLLSVASVYASNPKTKVYSNSNDRTKEYITVDSETSKALSKSVFNYDSDGTIKERALYQWIENQGWVGTQKYSYEYNSDKLATIVYTKWDKETNAWGNTSKHLIHVYDRSGELLAVEEFEVENKLMASK
ncbi:DUF3836 domain-containing protein [Dysgonomonas sp. 521]|uniref:DUF3836 domain-containing protein n=1 Tax=Dysgonomonas sp. 521 TaxID=2302932 RepID=UPI0013D3DB6A|nr:DUF3836 domain-containing protein [Dysgonomonas sp. 521]NDV93815.1 DUF3836 domain-containing protein [Dysgonomonas sp. 521]